MPDLTTNPVGGRLQRARQTAGISRTALAGAIGISEESLRSYETGRRRLPAELLPALGVSLGVDVAWLVGVPGSSRESIASTLVMIERLLKRVEDRLGAVRRMLEVPALRRGLQDGPARRRLSAGK